DAHLAELSAAETRSDDARELIFAFTRLLGIRVLRLLSGAALITNALAAFIDVPPALASNSRSGRRLRRLRGAPAIALLRLTRPLLLRLLLRLGCREPRLDQVEFIGRKAQALAPATGHNEISEAAGEKPGRRSLLEPRIALAHDIVDE